MIMTDKLPDVKTRLAVIGVVLVIIRYLCRMRRRKAERKEAGEFCYNIG